MELNEAIEILERSGITAAGPRIFFHLEPLNQIMATASESLAARRQIRRSATRVIRDFKFPETVNLSALRIDFLLIDPSGEDPYFTIIFSVTPGERKLFEKSFTADLKIDPSGKCTSIRIPDGFLSQVLIEFLNNI